MNASAALAALLLACAAHAYGQPVPAPAGDTAPARPAASGVAVLHGALWRASQTGTLRLAYRPDTVPFSFVPSARTRPVGYAVDLCRLTVQAVAEHLRQPVHIEWVAVGAADRFDALADGRADLLCGTTSATPARRQRTAFSPPMFITGSRLMVPVSSPVRQLSALAGQAVAVVAGTTVEQALPGLARQSGVAIRTVSYPDYAQAYAALSAGAVAALLADEVLLAGLLMQPDARASFRMAGPWLTHEVYGLAYRRDDAPLDQIVRDLWRRMAADGRLEGAYRRWFQRRLPDGGRMDLPMSLPMRTAIEMLGTGR